MLPVFFYSSVCADLVHCKTCRDKEGGRSWRESLRNAFLIPETDFECPRKNKWGYQNSPRGLGDTVARVIKKATGGLVKPCGGCKKRQEILNKLVPYKQKS